MSVKKKPSPKKEVSKKSKPLAKAVKAKAAAKPAAKAAAKPKAEAKTKPAAKAAAKKPAGKAPAAKAKPAAKAAAVKKHVAEAVEAIEEEEAMEAAEAEEVVEKHSSKAQSKSLKKDAESSSLMLPGCRFVKSSLFFDADKEEKEGKHKRGASQKAPDRPTASSRPKIGSVQDTKNLVELLSQQLEFENKMFLEGCEGQICVKCNVNNVDAKYYVDKSLGYCVDCAVLLGLGQSKEGVFSDAQVELMRRSMEKNIDSSNDMDEDDIENALGDMDSLELEEALLAVEEADFNA